MPLHPTSRMDSTGSEKWTVLGNNVPKSEIVYFSQILIVYVIIITSIVNLSLKNGNSELWISLLCSAIGYALPAPALNRKNGPLSVSKQPEL